MIKSVGQDKSVAPDKWVKQNLSVGPIKAEKPTKFVVVTPSVRELPDQFGGTHKIGITEL